MRVKQLKPHKKYLLEMRHHLFQILLSFSFTFCHGSNRKKKEKKINEINKAPARLLLLPVLTQCYVEEALFGEKFSGCSFVESSKAMTQLGTVAAPGRSSMAQLLCSSQGKGR